MSQQAPENEFTANSWVQLGINYKKNGVEFTLKTDDFFVTVSPASKEEVEGIQQMLANIRKCESSAASCWLNWKRIIYYRMKEEWEDGEPLGRLIVYDELEDKLTFSAFTTIEHLQWIMGMVFSHSYRCYHPDFDDWEDWWK